MKKSDKIFKFIGQVVVYLSIWATGVAFTMWALKQSIYF